MTWVSFRRYFYFPLLCLALVIAVAVIFALPPAQRLAGAIAAAACCLAPGIIGGWLLHDLFASRAHVARGEFVRALESARRFLRALERRPWIRHSIWTQYGIYTLNVRAMALNNAGAALMELGRLDEAGVVLHAATEADGAYPIPLYNLAVIAKLRGEEATSEALAREAARLGFARGRLDQVLLGIGQAYARLATPH